ncbi:hypothetical protein BLA24_15285 [Streptomyces cinnamoneus]|uniref:DUF397 domain-containing protein n=1 Tax=Streptomyces cinnamoneus TaxID=53446 RepID=A0A2G1XJJ8_STRCJ|nr:DUF397 domain-containing protein [Streptomyces cinnamoneus]PHQ51351.1 hypothetical protein BLA24_15285 [Streptomyces cinnamoneus]PPT16525.1 DUF397 domain-containing protein [Streptomyces cinnamoneus]
MGEEGHGGFIDTGGGSCVSVAPLTDQVAVRDSKQRNGPTFVVPATAWTAFVGGVQAGHLG